MNYEVPSNYRLAYSSSQISTKVTALGREIGVWVEETTKRSKQDVLAVCILRGGAFFFTDLLRAIPRSVEPTFCRTWSYSSATNNQSSQGVRVAVDEVVAEGRAILMVDDICDTGATLAKLERVFRDLGASDVKSAVLIRRVLPEQCMVPSWSAFEAEGNDWFVGYGMEDKNRFSNIPAVYKVIRR